MVGRAVWWALLKVGQPLQASAPPVPLHLPSPGHVPTCGFGDGEAAGVGMTCAGIGFTGKGESVVGFWGVEGMGGGRVGRVLWLKVL